MRQGVKLQIQLHNVNPGLAQDAKLAAADVGAHQGADRILAQAAGAGHARHLELRRRRRDIGIET
jgi:hypothetical protein